MKNIKELTLEELWSSLHNESTDIVLKQKLFNEYIERVCSESEDK